jgi:hypothetical protein
LASTAVGSRKVIIRRVNAKIDLDPDGLIAAPFARLVASVEAIYVLF